MISSLLRAALIGCSTFRTEIARHGLRRSLQFTEGKESYLILETSTIVITYKPTTNSPSQFETSACTLQNIESAINQNLDPRFSHLR